MKRIEILVPVGFVSLAIACGGGGTPPMDDAGPIIVVDSGETLPDAFVPPDASDEPCGEVPPTGWSPLPASCLPRCSRETYTAVHACAGMADAQSCALAAFHADTTPPTHVRYGAAYVFDVSCAGSTTAYSCIEWQYYSCDIDNCPAEYNTWATCAGGGAPCTTERSALDTCENNTAAWHTCAQMRSDACFGS
jgi:hypothetical protein